jgi:hypothetical protein
MRAGPLLAVAAAALAAGLAGACSIPEKHLVDAQVAPFACLGQPLPAVASPQITIAGTLADRINGNALANTAVEAFFVGTPAPVFMIASDARGSFTREQASGGTPPQVVLHALPNGYLETYFYSAVPVARRLDATIQPLTAMDLVTIGAVAQVAIDTAKVNLVISVVDCNGDPVPGASITTVPAGPIRYFVDRAPSPTAIMTDATTGAALVANVAPGDTLINATVAGMTLRSHAITGVAGTVVQTSIQP